MIKKMNCKIVPFETIYKLVKKVAEQVDKSNFKPNTIIGIARGGWVPARLLCDFLGITDLISLKVEHWLQTGKTKDEATIKYPLFTELNEKRVLVVDDIADTGKSLIESTKYLNNLKPKEIRTATMQYLPASKFRPDYFAEEVSSWAWFIYPWNWIEDTSTLIVRIMSDKKEKNWSMNTIRKWLLEYFNIKWSNEMLGFILEVMQKRGQLEISGNEKISYKFKEANIIQL